MFSLLIVDDEITVTNGLAFNIDWESINVGNVFRANSSEDAIRIMSDNKIDIVLSDINMPETDGIQLAARVCEKWPFTKIIFYSAYDSFAYAQKAILLNVFRYITKPSSNDEIMECVRQACLKLEEEYKNHQIIDDAVNSRNQALPILQERYMNAWLVHERLDPIKDSSQYTACGLALSPDAYSFLVLLRIDEYQDQLGAENEAGFESRQLSDIMIEKLIKEVLFKHEKGIHFTDSSGNIIILFQHPSAEAVRVQRQYVSEIADTFQKVVKTTANCTVSIFIGDVEHDITRLPQNCKLLSKASIISGINQEHGTILFETTALKNTLRLDSLWSYPSLHTLLESLQKDAALEKIKEVFSELLRRRSEVTGEALLHIYSTVCNAIIEISLKKGVTLSLWAGEDELAFYRYAQVESFDRLEAWCVNVIEKFIPYIAGQELGSAKTITEKVKKILLENMYANISQAEVAKKLFLHPNYMSRIFKQTEGRSITDYYISLKIAKAKELLGRPGTKVIDVSEALGYESSTYFNRLFKRETGVTPKEWQSLSH